MNTPYDKKEFLKKKIVNNSILFGDEEEVPVPGYLMDLRVFLTDPEASTIAAELAWEQLRNHNFQVLICKGVAGVLWAIKIQSEAFKHGKNLKLMILRDSKKPHNRKRLIEGDRPSLNDVAFFVDDLTHSGKTRSECEEALKKEFIDLPIIGTCVILDFWRVRSRAAISTGHILVSLFKRPDLGLTRKDPELKITYDNDPIFRILTENLPGGHEITSPVSLVDNYLYIATNDHYVRCIDLKTKEILWQYKNKDPQWHYVQKGILNILCITNDSIIFTSYHGFVTKLNRFTGKVIWRVYGDTWIHSSAIVDQACTRVFFSTEYQDNKKPGGDLVCLDYNSGNLIWRTKTDNLMPCTPCLDDERVYVSSNDSWAYCMCAQTGKILWKTPMKSPAKGKPAVFGEKVIFVTEGGWIYLLNKSSGNIENIKQAARSFRHVVPYIHSDQKFIVGDQEGYIKCFDNNLELQWITETRDRLNWYPTNYRGRLYFTGLFGYLIGIDPDTGEKVEFSQLVSNTGSPVVITDQFLIVNFSRKGLIVYDR
jgi:outer membrane protein assembly factor BamB/orotate phosphoribosyltransferase